MQKHSIFQSRTTSVVVGSALLVSLGGVSGAFAAAKITSEDIKNGEVKKADIGPEAVGGSELTSEVKDRFSQPGPQGPKGDPGPQGEPGDPATYAGVNWSLIDRNTIGNGDAYLRSGPSSAAFGSDVKPPLGVGSLGLRTGSPDDKVAFGNQVDFVGDKVADLNTVKYSVFTTGENGKVATDNLPGLGIEVDPDGPSANANNYSTLVYVPQGEKANENKWAEQDASTAKRWYFTGTTGTNTGCNQTTYCTLDEVATKLPDASIYTLAISKGRDNAFIGAVDKLVVNDATYDFEPFGVKETS